MEKKKVIIIGGGISGLCAGSYLQMNGYDTEIYELHSISGGLCTAWKRNGYLFDFCIHWLQGSSPGDAFYDLWKELIDMDQLEFVDPEVFFQIEDKEGERLRVFTQVDKLEEEMKRVAPEDSEIIDQMVEAIKQFIPFQFSLDKTPEVMNVFDKIKMIKNMLPYFKVFKKWEKMPARELSRQCKNPLLKRAILEMFIPDGSVFFFLMALMSMHKKAAGYPIGGSLKFARLIEKKYKNLGGKIHFRSKVNKIQVEDHKAVGIQLESGDVVKGDVIVSAADGYDTIFNMLKGKYLDNKIQDYYSGRSKILKLFPSLVFVSLGVAREFVNEPHSLVFPLDKPLVVDNSISHQNLSVRIFNFDPTLAPEGKTSLTVMLGTYNDEYWVDLRKKDPQQYNREKDRIAKGVIDALEKRLGDIKDKVEVVDVSTPASIIRYTNNWKGSFEGWQPTPGTMMLRLKKTLPGLKNFYMIGQWLHPGGGLPPAIMSGRAVAQILCKKDRRKFMVT